MNKEEKIENLKTYIKTIYDETNKQLRPNIFRGHCRSICTDIEDALAIFLSEIISKNDYKIFSDPSIYINRKNHRPDLLVVNQNNEVVFMIEIKANMCWCRDAKNVLDGMVDNDCIFKKQVNLKCEFSKGTTQNVIYKNPKLLLVSLTNWNCSETRHAINKNYATSVNINQYNLFSGWYDNLTNCEIDDFYEFIISNT